MTPLYIAIGVLVIVLAAVIILFNQLVGKRNMVNNGWADIDVQLKRRGRPHTAIGDDGSGLCQS